jgi:hypothetical protein
VCIHCQQNEESNNSWKNNPTFGNKDGKSPETINTGHYFHSF